jgi:hypothetical protein
MTADKIMALIRARHAEDLVVDQCKDGPTRAGLLQLDVWVMPRSWAHPETIGYEIKVSRQDFIRDQKWPDYMLLVNQFYFAAAPGIIQVEELPPGVGLLEASKNCAKLMMKRKAHFRQIAEPTQLFRYVLMCRTKITRDNGPGKVDFWKQWLETKEVDARFGSMLGKTMREEYLKKVELVAAENRRLRDEMERYDAHKAALKEMGWNNISTWKLRQEMGAGLTNEDKMDLKECARLARKLEVKLAK